MKAKKEVEVSLFPGEQESNKEVIKNKLSKGRFDFTIRHEALCCSVMRKCIKQVMSSEYIPLISDLVKAKGQGKGVEYRLEEFQSFDIEIATYKPVDEIGCGFEYWNIIRSRIELLGEDYFAVFKDILADIYNFCKEFPLLTGVEWKESGEGGPYYPKEYSELSTAGLKILNEARNELFEKYPEMKKEFQKAVSGQEVLETKKMNETFKNTLNPDILEPNTSNKRDNELQHKATEIKPVIRNTGTQKTLNVGSFDISICKEALACNFVQECVEFIINSDLVSAQENLVKAKFQEATKFKAFKRYTFEVSTYASVDKILYLKELWSLLETRLESLGEGYFAVFVDILVDIHNFIRDFPIHALFNWVGKASGGQDYPSEYMNLNTAGFRIFKKARKELFKKFPEGKKIFKRVLSGQLSLENEKMTETFKYTLEQDKIDSKSKAANENSKNIKKVNSEDKEIEPKVRKNNSQAHKKYKADYTISFERDFVNNGFIQSCIDAVIESDVIPENSLFCNITYDSKGFSSNQISYTFNVQSKDNFEEIDEEHNFDNEFEYLFSTRLGLVNKDYWTIFYNYMIDFKNFMRISPGDLYFEAEKLIICNDIHVENSGYLPMTNYGKEMLSFVRETEFAKNSEANKRFEKAKETLANKQEAIAAYKELTVEPSNHNFNPSNKIKITIAAELMNIDFVAKSIKQFVRSNLLFDLCDPQKDTIKVNEPKLLNNGSCELIISFNGKWTDWLNETGYYALEKLFAKRIGQDKFTALLKLVYDLENFAFEDGYHSLISYETCANLKNHAYLRQPLFLFEMTDKADKILKSAKEEYYDILYKLVEDKLFDSANLNFINDFNLECAKNDEILYLKTHFDYTLSDEDQTTNADIPQSAVVIRESDNDKNIFGEMQELSLFDFSDNEPVEKENTSEPVEISEDKCESVKVEKENSDNKDDKHFLLSDEENGVVFVREFVENDDEGRFEEVFPTNDWKKVTGAELIALLVERNKTQFLEQFETDMLKFVVEAAIKKTIKFDEKVLIDDKIIADIDILWSEICSSKYLDAFLKDEVIKQSLEM